MKNLFSNRICSEVTSPRLMAIHQPQSFLDIFGTNNATSLRNVIGLTRQNIEKSISAIMDNFKFMKEGTQTL